MRIAIIDLGTNTCNLLIAELLDHKHQVIYKSKESVKLGKGGIHKNILSEAAMLRAVTALKKHQESIRLHGGVDVIKAFATSAVRDAANKDYFVELIYKETNIALNVISGNEEASLIYNGVVLALDNILDDSIILDIGGGSNEFILSNNKQAVWKQSFPTGIARIVEQFEISNPITEEQCKQITTWLEAEMQDLWSACKNQSLKTLIGCSGTFDTIADMIDQVPANSKERTKQDISMPDFKRVSKILINSTLEERRQMSSVEEMRIEMIVPALLLIELVINKLGIKQIIQTDYALKEGAIKTYLR